MMDFRASVAAYRSWVTLKVIRETRRPWGMASKKALGRCSSCSNSSTRSLWMTEKEIWLNRASPANSLKPRASAATSMAKGMNSKGWAACSSQPSTSWPNSRTK